MIHDKCLDAVLRFGVVINSYYYCNYDITTKKLNLVEISTPQQLMF